MGATASAIVTVTVEVPVPGGWGSDCTIEQVNRQASEKAQSMLNNAIGPTKFRLVGDPKVKKVIVG